ncbi:hypothetical protein [Microbulbifer epialgicus]|uniref:Uncharacterized protein n=1 Tax=Microbulbifer epialgicus TaxID=393907 RepID=A0ABV4P2F4_9GAMM
MQTMICRPYINNDKYSDANFGVGHNSNGHSLDDGKVLGLPLYSATSAYDLHGEYALPTT